MKTFPISLGMTPAYFDADHMLLRAQLKCLSQQTYKDFDVWLIDPHYHKRKSVIPELADRFQLNLVHLPYTPNPHVAKRLDCAVFNAVYCYSSAPRIARYSCWRFVRPNWTESMMNAPAGVNLDYYSSNTKPDCPESAHPVTDHNTRVWNYDSEDVHWDAVPKAFDQPGAAWAKCSDVDTAQAIVPGNCCGNVMWWRDQWLNLNGTDEVFTNVEHYEDINFCRRAIHAKQQAIRKAKLLYRMHHRYGGHDGRTNHPFDTPFTPACEKCLAVVCAQKRPENDRFDLRDRAAKGEVALFEEQNVWVCKKCKLSASIWYEKVGEHVEFLIKHKVTQASIVPEYRIGRNLRTLAGDLDKAKDVASKVEIYNDSWTNARYYDRD